ncbi:ribonuclease Z [uncultured Microscilla sp.]|uniref:ribonuclease Z n=1 Tax=uncultured Microscilla sp. TaxID=432653 RepID=UPI00262C381E|nr:ribonuclease Z [uncultured Microscilla sp.]
MFQVTILGSGAALPVIAPDFRRYPTSQIVSLPHTHLLIDCGEGTQMRLQELKIRINRIKHIFISHLHGDHYLGLVGLLSSMHLNKRNQDLYLYGPPGLAEIISVQLKYSQTRFNYKIHFKELKIGESEEIMSDGMFTIRTIPLNHRIPCNGFLIQENPKKRKIIKEKIPEEIWDWQYAKILQKGDDILDPEGKVLISAKDVTVQPKSRTYAYCSDTAYHEPIIEHIKGVDMLYHEATFTNEEIDRATDTFHSTARQAATIASKAEVGKLLIGHFSSRYRNHLDPLIKEAREVFGESYLAVEGNTFVLEKELLPVE